MGKTQSKRSVDITIEGKKTGEDEITGKLEKIEDVDQRKQGNGDASQESNEKKIDTEEPENDKDLTTEKCVEPQENTETVNASVDTAKDTPSEGNANEEVSNLTDDCAKKSKKEKVKKKWSFRNISFGRKDKQKPSKSEETTEEISPNGDADKSEAAIEKIEASNDSGAAGDADTTQDAKIVVTENDNVDDKKATPTKKSPEAEVGIGAAICSTVEEVSEVVSNTETTTDTQTDEKEITSTAEPVEVIASNVIKTADNKNETALNEKVTAITIDNSESSELIKEVISKEVKKIENDKCEDEKPQENGTIEEQHTNSLIEVNTDKSSEEPIRSDPTVPNDNEENESVVAVDNNEKQNEIKNQANLCDYNEKSVVQNDSLPPPLPCSPPPSQVSVFAFSNSTESDVSTSKDACNSKSTKVESPTNAELNELINDVKNENENQNDKNTEEKTANITISNELKNNANTILLEDQLLNSTSNIHDLNCIKLDSPSDNLIDINCSEETQEIETNKPSEKEEIIAATVVKEITETAVMLCEQQIKDDEHHSNKESSEQIEDKDCVVDPPSTNSILTNDIKETLTEICKELHMETKTFLGQEDCSIEKIDQLKLSDELINDSEISKELSKSDNAPEVTTQELTVSCE